MIFDIATNGSGKIRGVIICALLFALGVCSQYFQMSLLRELAVRFSGLELTYAAGISACMIWTALGCVIACKLRRSFEKNFFVVIACLCSLTPVVAALSWTVAQTAPNFFNSRIPGSFSINEMLLFASLAPMPFGILNGLAFGVMSSALKKDSAPGAYAINAGGDALGGLSFSIILAGLVPPLMTLSASGFIFPLIALLILFMPGLEAGFLKRSAAVLIVLYCAAALALMMFMDKKVSAVKWERLVSGFVHERTVETPHGRFDFLRRNVKEEKNQDFDKRKLSISKDEGRTEIYLDGSHVASLPLEKDIFYPPSVFSALQLGRGNLKVMLAASPFSGMPQALRDLPVISKIDFVCPDGALIKAAKEYGTLPEESEDFKIIKKDPRAYLESPLDMLADSQFYDLIIVLDCSPETLGGNRFFTKEFYNLASKHLKSDGVMICSMPSANGFIGESSAVFNASVLKTVSSVFSKTAITPGESKLIAAGGVNVTGDFAELEKRQTSLIPNFKQFPPGMLSVCYSQSEQETETKAITDKTESVSVNTDFFPVLPFYYLSRHARMVSGDAESPGAIVRLMELVSKHWLMILLASGVIYLLARTLISRAVDANLIFGSFENGFYAAGVELLLLFVYQNHCGSLYRDIAAAAGVFIAGTAAGALFSPASAKIRDRVMFSSALIPAVLPAGFFLPQAAVMPCVFALLALAGFSAGAVYTELNKRAALKIGGALWAWEMLGGAAGALLIILFILPAGGFVPCVIALSLARLPAVFRAAFKLPPAKGSADSKSCASL